MPVLYFLAMKNSLLFLFISFFAFVSAAQNKQDSIPKPEHITIAIVPFMPQMYSNDLARLWYKTGESVCSEKQIREISDALVLALSDSLGKNYGLIDLNVSQTISTTDFLLEYYLLGTYSFADTVPLKQSKYKLVRKNKAKKVKKNPGIRNGQIQDEKQDRTYQFLNVNIRDQKKFRALCRELGVDEVLYINQFDVKGNFSSYSSGRETKYFINIHYSLYDKNAHLILGNKTKFATTNEKARYPYFLNHDLRMAVSEISKKIQAIHRQQRQTKQKTKKKSQ